MGQARRKRGDKRRKEMSKIHLQIFPAWKKPGEKEEQWPHHAVFYKHMRAARMLGPEALGLKLGSGDDDYKAAIALCDAYDALEDVTNVRNLRPEGGYMRFDNHAFNRQKQYWEREDRNEGPVGYKALLGDARIRIIVLMQKMWDDEELMREVTPEEFAVWQAEHPEWQDLYPVEPVPEDKKEETDQQAPLPHTNIIGAPYN